MQTLSKIFLKALIPATLMLSILPGYGCASTGPSSDLFSDLPTSELSSRLCILTGPDCVFQNSKKRFLRKDLPRIARTPGEIAGWVCFDPTSAKEAASH